VTDRLVLAKIDLAAAEVADRPTKRLRYINRGAPLWRGVEDDLDADAPLSADGDGVERWQPADDHTVDDHHRHGQHIRTLALSFGEPVDWTRFGIWLTILLHRHGNELLRAKGILNVADSENAGGGSCGAAPRAAASGRVARWGSAVASGIHRPGARSSGDRAPVPRLQQHPHTANGSRGMRQ
jgi:G3E family GTPase